MTLADALLTEGPVDQFLDKLNTSRIKKVNAAGEKRWDKKLKGKGHKLSGKLKVNT